MVVDLSLSHFTKRGKNAEKYDVEAPYKINPTTPRPASNRLTPQNTTPHYIIPPTSSPSLPPPGPAIAAAVLTLKDTGYLAPGTTVVCAFGGPARLVYTVNALVGCCGRLGVLAVIVVPGGVGIGA